MSTPVREIRVSYMQKESIKNLTVFLEQVAKHTDSLINVKKNTFPHYFKDQYLKEKIRFLLFNSKFI